MRAALVAAAIVVALVAPGVADGFEGRPPLNTLNGSTAYALNRGEIRISSLRVFFSFPHVGVPFSLSQFKWLNAEYGLTDRLMIGATLLENVLEGPNIWAKFNALRTRSWAVAMPLEIDVNLSPFVAGIGSGLAAGWQPTPQTTLHSGLRFWAFDGQVQLTHIYAALEVALFDHTHLFVETDVWPLVVEIGSLSRFRALNLEVSSRLIEDTNLNLDLELELFARF